MKYFIILLICVALLVGCAQTPYRPTGIREEISKAEIIEIHKSESHFRRTELALRMRVKEVNTDFEYILDSSSFGPYKLPTYWYCQKGDFIEVRLYTRYYLDDQQVISRWIEPY